MAGSILSQLNRDRAAIGLVPLRTDSRLIGLAANRAGWMAATGDLSHDSWGGAVYDAVALVGVSAWSSAEAVASTNATFGPDAAAYLYNLWHGSPEHWGFMMSRTFNYIGVGVGYRAATGESYASLVFAEAPDSSAPVVRLRQVRPDGVLHVARSRRAAADPHGRASRLRRAVPRGPGSVDHDPDAHHDDAADPLQPARRPRLLGAGPRSRPTE